MVRTSGEGTANWIIAFHVFPYKCDWIAEQRRLFDSHDEQMVILDVVVFYRDSALIAS